MSFKLAILGLLMERDMHPYEIRQTMKDRNMHRTMRLQDGSLYYAVDQLRKEDCIEVVEVVKEASRPDKTIYRITAKGREQFQELLLQQFREKKVIQHPLYVALPFAAHGDQSRIAEALETKLAEAEQRVRDARAVYEEHASFVPKAVLHLMAGYYSHSKVEVSMLRRLLQDAREGRLGDKGAFWDLDAAE
jgi:DNA-binding PadR family transcriptional regulator